MKKFCLLIDTSALRSIVAICGKRGVLIDKYLDTVIVSNKHFLNIVSESMRHTTISFKNIIAVIVARGPGLFTNTKMGIAYTKGVCCALNIYSLGVDSLELLIISSPFLIAYKLSIIVLVINKKEYFIQRFILLKKKNLFYKEQIIFRKQLFTTLYKYQFIITQDYFIFLKNKDNCLYLKGPLSSQMLKLALKQTIKKKNFLNNFSVRYYKSFWGSYI